MAKLVCDARYERRLRADDDEVDLVLAAEREQPIPLPEPSRDQCFKGVGGAHLFLVAERGVDRREWETEWEGLEPLIIDAPAEALPEVDRLIERMLIERGYPTTEDKAAEAADPAIVAEFLEARRITSLVDTGETSNPSDIGAAVTAYRNLYEFLLAGDNVT